MNTSIAPSRALGAVYLILLGFVGFAIAAYLVVAGSLDVANGSLFPRSGGGLPQVAFGAFYGASAVWVARRGLRARREAKREGPSTS